MVSLGVRLMMGDRFTERPLHFLDEPLAGRVPTRQAADLLMERVQILGVERTAVQEVVQIRCFGFRPPLEHFERSPVELLMPEQLVSRAEKVFQRGVAVR